MEYWGSTADDGLILFSGSCRPFEKDPIPTNPVFQRSYIPSLHGLNNGKANFL
jgi:hypothetical protein